MGVGGKTAAAPRFRDGRGGAARQISGMLRRAALLLLLLTGAAGPVGAQFGSEVARQHADRVGPWRAELRALRAEGRMIVGTEEIPLRTWAERPNRLRVESGVPERRVVQCFDGRHQPWLSHPGIEEGAPQLLTTADARDFMGNADFDGPLVDYARKGITVDYAGEEPVAGRRAYKLLVMSARDDVAFYWVDASTLDIVKRAVYRAIGGQRTAVETFFSDYRPVGGVPQPHRIETRVGERVLYVILIDRMEASPEGWPDTLFAPPPGWPLLGGG